MFKSKIKSIIHIILNKFGGSPVREPLLINIEIDGSNPWWFESHVPNLITKLQTFVNI